MRVTISLPCYGRPLRTIRSIEAILAQEFVGWEAFIMGDGCQHFQELIDSGWLEEKAQEAEKEGNKIHYFNLKTNMGGCGYALTNHAIQEASGKFFTFYANDDIILSSHLQNYMSEIEDTDYDFVYYNSWVAPDSQIRHSSLAPCRIGHSELIVRTEFLKQMPPHQPVYMHDWHLIEQMAIKGKHKKALSTDTTYHVMKVPHGNADTID